MPDSVGSKNKTDFYIVEVRFRVVLQVWKKFLWPNRKSKIERLSCIAKDGAIDSSITKYKSRFFACYKEGVLAGVVSCHPVSKNTLRLRGIYVFAEFRKQNVGVQLVEHVKKVASASEFKEVFGLIRVTNKVFFEKNGFVVYQETNQYEFGPHVLMSCSVDKNSRVIISKKLSKIFDSILRRFFKIQG